MPKTGVILVLVALGWFGGPTAQAGTVAEDVRRTADLLFDASSGHRDVAQQLRHLVELATGIGRKAGLPAATVAKLDAAAARTRTLSPLDESARAVLSEAYAALSLGRPFEFPKTVGSIDQAREHGRGLVEKSLAALSAGRAQDAARELLAVVLLVITPMEASR